MPLKMIAAAAALALFALVAYQGSEGNAAAAPFRALSPAFATGGAPAVYGIAGAHS